LPQKLLFEWDHSEHRWTAMKIRNKLIIGFTAIILFSGAMGFSAVDGIQRTSQLTNELFEYPLMASNFARGAQTAFVRMRVAGNDEPLVTVRENALREDLAIVAERLRDPAGPALIAHIDAGLRNLARLRTARALIAEQGGSLGETLLRQEVAFSLIDEDFESLVELAVVEGFDFMLAAENESTELFNIQIFLVCLMLGLGLGIALYLGRQFARPIQAITAVTSRLAMGDDKVEIPGGRRRDEIGAMARALEIFNAASRGPTVGKLNSRSE
jgi:methyl-accepting chemotaxis protein